LAADHDVIRNAVVSTLFFVAAPGTVAFLIPFLLTRWESHDWHAATIPARLVGATLFAGGAGALVHSFYRFVVEGRGTPAPVAPPTALVVRGLYGYVRNPMYVAILMIVIGQALWFGRFILLGYAAGLWVTFHLFVVSYEEPKLGRVFGASYEAYRSKVGRWVPRGRTRPRRT
jgi:protein-S-isoprenylcysteine O-methyltransferase Ste14